MSKLEQKIIEWLNCRLKYIAVAFTVIAALWIRLRGMGYMGHDYHLSLYDLPGNCNPLPYRILAGFLMRSPDTAIACLKCIAYAGDFAVAFLSLLLFRGKKRKPEALSVFFILTACLLSPVSLIYSVGGMKIDSVCMSLLLAGLLLSRKDFVLPAWFFLVLAAFLSPAYWPVTAGLLAYIVFTRTKEKKADFQTAAAIFLYAMCLILSIFLEQRGAENGYFFGKLFFVNPSTGERYSGLGQWLMGMGSVYGYFAATASLLSAFSRKKTRIPALLLQLLVIMYVGWQQTSFLAI